MCVKGLKNIERCSLWGGITAIIVGGVLITAGVCIGMGQGLAYACDRLHRFRWSYFSC